MSEPREFRCTDCGSDVFAFGASHAANDVDLCCLCLWIRTIDDGEEREGLRRFLERVEVPTECEAFDDNPKREP